ncbi:MAG: DivIVA domain-containing protein [Bacillota bacterium]
MPLTPLDIHNKEFRRAFRGYSEEEVDEFLDEVVRDFDSLIKENAALKDELEHLRVEVSRSHGLEETLESTLVMAQRTSEDVREAARREAENIIREASIRSDREYQTLREKADRARHEFETLQRQVNLFRLKMRSILQAQLEMLQEPQVPGDTPIDV